MNLKPQNAQTVTLHWLSDPADSALSGVAHDTQTAEGLDHGIAIDQRRIKYGSSNNGKRMARYVVRG